MFPQAKYVTAEADSNVIRVPQDYPVIQWAINAANSGDSVLVDYGTYEECLHINKSISLIGRDKDGTIIDALHMGNVVTITADYVCVSGFTIKKSPSSGIVIEDCHCVSVFDNIITENNLQAICLYSSTTQNLIFENTIVNNYPWGFYFYSENNSIFRNNFIDNYIQIGGEWDKENNWDNGAEGNYWDNYKGKDFNGDGIGDTFVPHDLDRYPLMEPWSLVRRFDISWNGENYDARAI